MSGLKSRLGQYLGTDSIRVFEAAAASRWLDAETLRRGNRRLSAIYLYGYSSEMLIKAAYFRTIGHGPDQTVTEADRRSAARQYDRAIPPLNVGQHHIANWARLLVRKRRELNLPYAPGFAQEIMDRSDRLYSNWVETMRYRSSKVLRAELDQVRTEASWLRGNYPMF